jgi:hypothetical protein
MYGLSEKPPTRKTYYWRISIKKKIENYGRLVKRPEIVEYVEDKSKLLGLAAKDID